MASSNESRGLDRENDIDLAELVRVLWSGKWFISSIALAAAVVALIIALLTPNIYRAEALLLPNHQEREGSLATLASQYSGLAGLAGIALRTRDTDTAVLAMEVMRSRRFVATFVEQHDLLVPLMASVGWDPESGSLLIDTDKFDSESGRWVRKIKNHRSRTPSMQEAHEVFLEIVDIYQDQDSGFVYLSVEHHSPVIAQEWVDLLIADLNQNLLEQDVIVAESAISYLQKQINATSLAELQAVFFRLLEDQLKTVMLANATPEYVFQTIDPAVVPEKKIRPRRVLLVVAGLVVGLFSGVLIWLGRVGFRRQVSLG